MRAICFAFLLVALFISISALASAYQPPMYIANPETKECQYYFAGEQDCFDACMNDCQGAGLNYTNCMDPCANKYCHYNLKPAGFTIDIGETAGFKSVNESCKVWQNCANSGGVWNSTTIKCLPEARKSASNILAIAGIAISLIALIAIILVYLKIRKMLRQIHVEKKAQ